MPTFTPGGLQGAGKSGSSPNGVKTFTFTNPGNPAYFTLEQITDNLNNIGRINGAMPGEAVDYTAGTFDAFNGISEAGIVQSKYKFSIIVPPGTNTVRFSPDDTSAKGSLAYRGTGNFTLSF